MDIDLHDVDHECLVATSNQPGSQEPSLQPRVQTRLFRVDLNIRAETQTKKTGPPAKTRDTGGIGDNKTRSGIRWGKLLSMLHHNNCPTFFF